MLFTKRNENWAGSQVRGLSTERAWKKVRKNVWTFMIKYTTDSRRICTVFQREVVCLLFPCLYACFHIYILRIQKKMFTYVQICSQYVVLNLSKINLSGIFTIENIFLPFRNLIVACVRVSFFFNSDHVMFLKESQLSFQSYEHLRAWI